jgi:hypothetical protein
MKGGLMKNYLRRREFQQISKKLFSNPLTLYIAGGIGAYFLGKTIYQLYLTNPKFSELVKNTLLPQKKEGQV